MPQIIKLDVVKNIFAGEVLETEEILFNSFELILAKTDENGNTHITYKEALINRFVCIQTISEIYALMKER